MNKINFHFIIFLIISSILLTSCEAIGDIFQTGLWFGVIGVILVVGLVFWLLGKMRK